MADHSEIMAKMLKAAAQIEAENDNFLRAIAMVAANGRAHIVPTDNNVLEPSRPIILLPRKQYDRLEQIIAKDQGNV